MRVLVGCEESQAVCIELRKIGHEAYSCDLQECSGGHPEWHLQMDVFQAIKLKYWDMGIFFPDCTYLTISANAWYKDQPVRKSGTLVGQARRDAREQAIEFFIRLYNCGLPKIAIENPIGVMSSRLRKPDQVIQPYNFGDDTSKQTCLWLRNLSKLVNTNYFEPRIVNGKKRWSNQCDNFGHEKSSPSPERAKNRSKTFPGIAKAIAEQWGGNLTIPDNGIAFVRESTPQLRLF